MRLFVARNPYSFCVSKRPIKLVPRGFGAIPQAEGVRYLHLDPDSRKVLGLTRSAGALIDVSLTPAEGYAPVRFEACYAGARTFFRRVPLQDKTGLRTAYVKVLKVEQCPVPDFTI